MCRAEAVITIKHSFKSKGKQEKENLRTCKWRKDKKDKNLEILTAPRNILFYKNYKKLGKTNLKYISITV